MMHSPALPSQSQSSNITHSSHILPNQSSNSIQPLLPTTATFNMNGAHSLPLSHPLSQLQQNPQPLQHQHQNQVPQHIQLPQHQHPNQQSPLVQYRHTNPSSQTQSQFYTTAHNQHNLSGYPVYHQLQQQQQQYQPQQTQQSYQQSAFDPSLNSSNVLPLHANLSSALVANGMTPNVSNPLHSLLLPLPLLSLSPTVFTVLPLFLFPLTSPILPLILPTASSHLARTSFYSHLQSHLRFNASSHFLFGSVPLHTYLPSGDLDVGLICEKGKESEVLTKLKESLEEEEMKWREWVKMKVRKEKEKEKEKDLEKDSMKVSVHHNHSPSIASIDMPSQPIRSLSNSPTANSDTSIAAPIVTNITSTSSPLASSPSLLSIQDIQPFPIHSITLITGSEIKLLKCTLGNTLLLDVSCNTTSALATVCFLEECDRQIDAALLSYHKSHPHIQPHLPIPHLYKTTLLLTKAWSLYESRILASHHSLLSTYAIETLLLYICNWYYHFHMGIPVLAFTVLLDVAASIDWDLYAVSVGGLMRVDELKGIEGEGMGAIQKYINLLSQTTPPIMPKSSYYQPAPTPLLHPSFFLFSLSIYTLPHAHHSNILPPMFHVKHINIIDPLDPCNNLGRSVSFSNSWRIRAAWAKGRDDIIPIIEEVKGIESEIRTNWFGRGESINNDIDELIRSPNLLEYHIATVEKENTAALHNNVPYANKDSDVTNPSSPLSSIPSPLVRFSSSIRSFIPPNAAARLHALYSSFATQFDCTISKHKGKERADVSVMRQLANEGVIQLSAEETEGGLIYPINSSNSPFLRLPPNSSQAISNPNLYNEQFPTSNNNPINTNINSNLPSAISSALLGPSAMPLPPRYPTLTTSRSLYISTYSTPTGPPTILPTNNTTTLIPLSPSSCPPLSSPHASSAPASPLSPPISPPTSSPITPTNQTSISSTEMSALPPSIRLMQTDPLVSDLNSLKQQFFHMKQAQFNNVASMETGQSSFYSSKSFPHNGNHHFNHNNQIHNHSHQNYQLNPGHKSNKHAGPRKTPPPLQNQNNYHQNNFNQQNHYQYNRNPNEKDLMLHRKLSERKDSEKSNLIHRSNGYYNRGGGGGRGGGGVAGANRSGGAHSGREQSLRNGYNYPTDDSSILTSTSSAPTSPQLYYNQTPPFSGRQHHIHHNQQQHTLPISHQLSNTFPLIQGNIQNYGNNLDRNHQRKPFVNQKYQKDYHIHQAMQQQHQQQQQLIYPSQSSQSSDATSFRSHQNQNQTYQQVWQQQQQQQHDRTNSSIQLSIGNPSPILATMMTTPSSALLQPTSSPLSAPLRSPSPSSSPKPSSASTSSSSSSILAQGSVSISASQTSLPSVSLSKSTSGLAMNVNGIPLITSPHISSPIATPTNGTNQQNNNQGISISPRHLTLTSLPINQANSIISAINSSAAAVPIAVSPLHSSSSSSSTSVASGNRIESVMRVSNFGHPLVTRIGSYMNTYDRASLHAVMPTLRPVNDIAIGVNSLTGIDIGRVSPNRKKGRPTRKVPNINNEGTGIINLPSYDYDGTKDKSNPEFNSTSNVSNNQRIKYQNRTKSDTTNTSPLINLQQLQSTQSYFPHQKSTTDRSNDGKSIIMRPSSTSPIPTVISSVLTVGGAGANPIVGVGAGPGGTSASWSSVVALHPLVTPPPSSPLQSASLNSQSYSSSLSSPVLTTAIITSSNSTTSPITSTSSPFLGSSSNVQVSSPSLSATSSSIGKSTSGVWAKENASFLLHSLAQQSTSSIHQNSSIATVNNSPIVHQNSNSRETAKLHQQRNSFEAIDNNIFNAQEMDDRIKSRSTEPILLNTLSPLLLSAQQSTNSIQQQIQPISPTDTVTAYPQNSLSTLSLASLSISSSSSSSNSSLSAPSPSPSPSPSPFQPQYPVPPRGEGGGERRRGGRGSAPNNR